MATLIETVTIFVWTLWLITNYYWAVIQFSQKSSVHVSKMVEKDVVIFVTLVLVVIAITTSVYYMKRAGKCFLHANVANDANSTSGFVVLVLIARG